MRAHLGDEENRVPSCRFGHCRRRRPGRKFTRSTTSSGIGRYLVSANADSERSVTLNKRQVLSVAQHQ